MGHFFAQDVAPTPVNLLSDCRVKPVAVALRILASLELFDHSELAFLDDIDASCLVPLGVDRLTSYQLDFLHLPEEFKDRPVSQVLEHGQPFEESDHFLLKALLYELQSVLKVFPVEVSELTRTFCLHASGPTTVPLQGYLPEGLPRTKLSDFLEELPVPILIRLSSDAELVRGEGLKIDEMGHPFWQDTHRALL